MHLCVALDFFPLSSVCETNKTVMTFFSCLETLRVIVKIASVSAGMCYGVLWSSSFRWSLFSRISGRAKMFYRGVGPALVAPTKARKTISIRSVPDARERRIVWTLLSLLHPSVFPVTCRWIAERICLLTRKISQL